MMSMVLTMSELDGDKGASSEQGSPGNAGASKKPGFALRLDAQTKQIEQASHSFSSVAQSFDATAKSFEEAGSKVDKLKKSKIRR